MLIFQVFIIYLNITFKNKIIDAKHNIKHNKVPIFIRA